MEGFVGRIVELFGECCPGIAYQGGWRAYKLLICPFELRQAAVMLESSSRLVCPGL